MAELSFDEQVKLLTDKGYLEHALSMVDWAFNETDSIDERLGQAKRLAEAARTLIGTITTLMEGDTP